MQDLNFAVVVAAAGEIVLHLIPVVVAELCGHLQQIHILCRKMKRKHFSLVHNY